MPTYAYQNAQKTITQFLKNNHSHCEFKKKLWFQLLAVIGSNDFTALNSVQRTELMVMFEELCELHKALHILHNG